MTRRTLSSRERLRLFQLGGGVCHLCGGKIDGTREKWEIEHVTALAMGGDDNDGNMKPAHVKCHTPKTADDMGRLAKAKRSESRHIGAKRSSRPLPGSRASGWKRRLDGTWKRRHDDA